MVAKKGTCVLVIGVHAGGTAEQAAVITNVFDRLASDPAKTDRVNVTIFPDGMAPTFRRSILYFENLAAANEVNAKMPFCIPANTAE